MARKSKWSKDSNMVYTLQKETYRVGIYLRLSVESENNVESNSLIHQYEQCWSFLQKHSDLKLCKTYTDNGYTGTNFKRDDFQCMIKDIQQGIINCVIVKDLSRFGRNYIDMDNYLNILFPAWNVRFIAVCDNLDTKHDDVNNMVVPLKNIFNEYYARDISQKIKSSIHTRIENQTFIPSSFVIPYGYLRDGENKTFRIDDEAAAVVRRIFLLRLEGKSFSEITRMLNQEGVPSAGRLRYLRGQVSSKVYENACWSKDYIRKLTSNTVYIGQRIHRKWIKDSFLSSYRLALRDEQIIVHHAHEPIVSEELFYKVQEINCLKAKDLKSVQGETCVSPLIQTLRRKIYCGDCGGKLCVTKHQHTGYIAECGRYQRSAHTRCCSHHMKLERITDAIEAELRYQYSIIDKISLESKNRVEVQQTSISSEKNQLEKQKKLLEYKKSQLLEDLADGLIERVEYDALYQHFNCEYKQILARITLLEQELFVHLQKIKRFQEWANMMRKVVTLQNITREVWDSLIEKVLVYSEGKKRTVKICFCYQDVYSDFVEVKHE